MIISYQWLMSLCSVKVSLDLLSKILTDMGLEVEAILPIEAVKGGLKGMIVGEVIACTPHPNADRLRCTQVNVGGDTPLQIVCGAENVAVGQKVVVAMVGAQLYPLNGNTLTIKKAKIRGVESNGMICAEDEIGLGDSHDGILILPQTARVGQAASEYFNLPETDYAIHIGLTPNRSDAHSHLGVAREVMAWWRYHQQENAEIIVPQARSGAGNEDALIDVQVKGDLACPRYMGVVLENIQVAPSPLWLQKRLQAIGLRPLNNVVDITNFVLHETGNPLHAFDADQLSRPIQVRWAEEKEELITLDDRKLTLSAHDLLIADQEKPLCLAGVMGGKIASVQATTTRIFLEAACFKAAVIRKTSLSHQIRSDAAVHFEKGVSISQVEFALKRAIFLFQEICGAKVAGGISDYYPVRSVAKIITLQPAYISQITGHLFTPVEVSNMLQTLGFTVEASGDYLEVSVPDYKTDILAKEDLAEEVLRLHGLDNIAIPKQLKMGLFKSEKNFDRYWEKTLSDLLVGYGFREILTNSIVNSKHYPQYDQALVMMINSLSAELNAMRPHMLLSGMEVVAYNSNRKNTDLQLFEFGFTYSKGEGDKYQQAKWLSCWLSGNRQAASWNQKTAGIDVYYVKGICAALAQRSGIRNLTFNADDPAQPVKILQGKKVLGYLRRATEMEKQTTGVKQEVWYLGIDWQVWVKAAAVGKMSYEEVIKYPSVARDLAVVVNKQLSFEQIQKTTRQLKLQPLQSFTLFDVFEHEKLGNDKKSLALNFSFQLKDRTLTDQETDELMERIVSAYQKEFQAQIRS